MNFIEKIIYPLQTKMTKPVSFGWFHILCLTLTLIVIVVLYLRKNYNSKNLKRALLVYGITALILEILKQVSWSFNYDELTGNIYWDYQWYSSAFQLCTMPIYFSILSAFLKKAKLKNACLSFIAFFTILGSISTMIYPESCFTEDILINIHTMFLHCGSFVVSVYLLMSKEVKLNIKNLFSGFIVFLFCVSFALLLDISFYKLGIIGNETFNMFFISPYFISTLPIFDVIQSNVPYIIFLLIYVFVFAVGGTIIYMLCEPISKIKRRVKLNE